jgi:anaerobic selenocysteine-containing dehydrogenase
MAWFKEHSFIKWPRKVEEIYPRKFIKARLPIYIENFIDKGKEVKRMTNKLGIPWDISGYQPLVNWKPPVAYEDQSPEFDLFIVNYKIPFHTWSHTTNNVWLNELGEYDPFTYYIRINKLTAKKKGLKEGDRVTLETADDNRVEGWIKLTDAIHPEVIGIAGCFGHWATGLPIAQARGVHYEKLFPNSVEQLLNRIDWITSGVDWILKVKISKVTGKYS